MRIFFLSAHLFFLLSTVVNAQQNEHRIYTGERKFAIGTFASYNTNINKAGPGLNVYFRHFLGKRIASFLSGSYSLYSFDVNAQQQLNGIAGIQYYPVKNFYFSAGFLGYSYYMNFADAPIIFIQAMQYQLHRELEYCLVTGK
jgi:hypothetical protein